MAKHGSPKNPKTPGGLLQGIAYGLVPHIGCMAFLALSVLGATAAASLFRPLLLSAYFFQGLMAASFGFATLTAALYLRKNGILSLSGAVRKWRYLSVLYGSTMAVNLLMFMVVFPYAATLPVNSAASPPMTGQLIAPQLSGASLTLSVDIPCSGHAPLVIGDLNGLPGVSARFREPNLFDVRYDPSRTSEKEILGLEVFEYFKAEAVEGGSL